MNNTIRAVAPRLSHGLLAASLALGAGFIAGCGSSPPAADVPVVTAPPERGVSYGVVRSVERVDAPRGGPGAGAIVGGVVGGVLGNQVGGGTGRTAATVAGAVGGAVVGNEIEKRNQPVQGANWRYVVDMDNGVQRIFTYDTDHYMQVGQRVMVVDGVLQRY